MRAVLDPAVDFRGLTPSHQWEAKTPDDLVNQVFTRWFEPSDEIYEVLEVSAGQVVDRQRVVYRYRQARSQVICLLGGREGRFWRLR